MIIIKDYITNEQKEALRKHALTLKKNGSLRRNQFGENRFYLKVYGTKYANAMIKNMEKRIRLMLNQDDIEVDPVLGWVISYIEPGGYIQQHYDNHDHYRESGRKHLRCNIVVSKEKSSGNPIVENKTYTVEENDMWIFFASHSRHGCEIVAGNKPRIVFQFGFSICDSELSSIAAKLRKV